MNSYDVGYGSGPAARVQAANSRQARKIVAKELYKQLRVVRVGPAPASRWNRLRAQARRFNDWIVYRCTGRVP